MTKEERGLLIAVNEKLKHGDIIKIAAESNYSREYCGMVLNPTNDHYNQKIVDAAVKVISNRSAGIKEKIAILNG